MLILQVAVKISAVRREEMKVATAAAAAWGAKAQAELDDVRARLRHAKEVSEELQAEFDAKVAEAEVIR